MLSNSYPAFLVSNEPEYIFPSDRKIHRHFAYVGTSVLKNLEIIKKIAGVTKTDMTQGALVPSLFIVDCSPEVKAVWAALKANFLISNSFLEFRANLVDKNLANTLFGNSRERSAVNAVFHCADYLTNLFEVNEASLKPNDLNSNDWYQYFRRIVIQMNFMHDDWCDPAVFEGIKKQLPSHMPVVVYASNILEYVLNEQNDPAAQEYKLNTLIKNIQLLTPTWTIHSRTLNGFRGGLKPGEIFTLDQVQAGTFETHKQALMAPKYKNMISQVAEFIVDPNDPMSILAMLLGANLNVVQQQAPAQPTAAPCIHTPRQWMPGAPPIDPPLPQPQPKNATGSRGWP